MESLTDVGAWGGTMDCATKPRRPIDAAPLWTSWEIEVPATTSGNTNQT
jgi:hypothetical protein